MEKLKAKTLLRQQCYLNGKWIDVYKKNTIPLPLLCPNCRHAERLTHRNPPKLWHRQCAKCTNEFETSYAPDRPEIIYCESCYQQEVA